MDRKRISVALATRNRGSSVVETVRSILGNDYADFEIVIADQSDDDATQKSVEILKDPRARYVRCETRGRSAAENAAIREARGELIAMTDDDCTVPCDWLREIEAAFAAEERIGVVFGNVIAAPHDLAAGCIPAYVRKDAFLARGIGEKHRVEGIGACMAVRREVWEKLGGFDEGLGAGTRFRAGEDGDFAIRALLAGYWIYETPAVYVTHHGLRKWADLPALIDGYWFGTGAVLAKFVRSGQWFVVPLMLRLAGRWIFGGSAVGASLGGGTRWRKLFAFVRGFAAGWMRGAGGMTV